MNSGEIIGLPTTVLDAMFVIGFDVPARSDRVTARLRNVKNGLACTCGWFQ